MEMLDAIQKLREEASVSIGGIKTAEDAENFRLQYLSRKGALAQLFERLKDVPKEDKPALGKSLNELRTFLESEFESAKNNAGSSGAKGSDKTDLSIPGRKTYIGRTHPLTQTADEIKIIFRNIGFGIADGPEIEDDYHNFEALNMPADHPARDMQDTLYLETPIIGGTWGAHRRASLNGQPPEAQVRAATLLRTHTSAMQIRYMQTFKPPVRIIVPGRVYRRDNLDLTHTPMFQQFEGLVGRSLAMRELFAICDRVAPTDAAALLLGETGTGKELVARALHARGPRRAGPFVSVNLGAISKELAAAELFGDPACRERGWFLPGTQARLLAEHRRGEADHHRLLWQLLVLEHEQHVPCELRAHETDEAGGNVGVDIDARQPRQATDSSGYW